MYSMKVARCKRASLLCPRWGAVAASWLLGLGPPLAHPATPPTALLGTPALMLMIPSHLRQQRRLDSCHQLWPWRR